MVNSGGARVAYHVAVHGFREEMGKKFDRAEAGLQDLRALLREIAEVGNRRHPGFDGVRDAAVALEGLDRAEEALRKWQERDVDGEWKEGEEGCDSEREESYYRPLKATEIDLGDGIPESETGGTGDDPAFDEGIDTESLRGVVNLLEDAGVLRQYRGENGRVYELSPLAEERLLDETGAVVEPSEWAGCTDRISECATAKIEGEEWEIGAAVRALSDGELDVEDVVTAFVEGDARRHLSESGDVDRSAMPEEGDQEEEQGMDVDPVDIDHSLDRIEQKRLAVELLAAAGHVQRERDGVRECDEQAAAIDQAVERLGDAAKRIWPGDEMPPLEEVAAYDGEDSGNE